MAKKDANKQTISTRPKRKCSVPIFNQRPKRLKTASKEEVNNIQSISTETKKTAAIKK